MTRNNGYAASAVESFASNLVGCGINPAWRIPEAAHKDVKDLWSRWTDECDAESVTDVDGIVASAASLIAMGADKIVMPENSFMVVLEPRGMTYGPAAAHHAMAPISIA